MFSCMDFGENNKTFSQYTNMLVQFDIKYKWQIIEGSYFCNN